MHNHHALLDVFAGCGTSLVEARMAGYDSFGIELNPLGRLLTEVKTTPLDLNLLKENKEKLTRLLESKSLEPKIPDFPNRDFWFEKNVQDQLGRLRSGIERIHNDKVRKFFLGCFVSIIRKCSNADPLMMKPVFTKRMHNLRATGIRPNAFRLFDQKFQEYSQTIANLNFLKFDKSISTIIGDDARQIKLKQKSVHLCITSPPFINAQDYFRQTKLEILWAGLATSGEIRELARRQIGMDISNVKNNESERLHLIGKSYSENVDKVISRVYEKDKKRAFIIYHYFTEIKKVFEETRRVLADEGVLVITIGDGTIRNVPIKTHELMIDVIEGIGFRTKKVSYDLIKTHNLVPKRNVTAGVMNREWAEVFTKT
jgi:hypothetical protein